ncbi:MAG: hypothetical protein J3K34DRAFT_438146 [Monoraphidium minutum]|nr:MAG: hypothetical protein J3K34DRAFT_438146 [Monoraphidium minutum]
MAGRSRDVRRKPSAMAATVASALFLLVAAPLAARAQGNTANARSTEHKAKGWSDPWDPALKDLESQGAFVRLELNEDKVTTVARSFLGLSYELDDVLGVASKDYMALLKQLSAYDNGPLMLRIGAMAADRMTGVWSAAVLNALTTLHRWTGAKFILGVNFHSENPEITKAQIARIKSILPSSAIESFAVGNEPDMYSLKPKDGRPGAMDPKPDTWLNDRWVPMSRDVYKAASNGERVLAGPGWSNLNMRAPLLKWWLDSVQWTLSTVTLHHYAGDIFAGPSIEDVLSEKTIEKDMSSLGELVKVTQKYSLPVRVTEAAILSYGGVQGVSDVAGAAIWVLDTAMEVAYRGATGINFHQGLKQENNANYNAVDYLNGRVRVRMPFYGYLLLQQALDGGADILSRSVSGECKVWVLKGHKAGDLRVLVLNKVNYKDCGVDVKLSADQNKRYKNEADVDYLYAGNGLYEKWQLYLSGLTFESWGTGHVRGDGDHLKVEKYWNADKSGGFAVSLLPGAKAMLVTIPQW